MDGRGRVAPEMVTDMVTVAEKYRRAYRYAPASKLLPLAHGHMDLSLALHPAWQTPAVRHTLISIAGEMEALAGVTLALDMVTTSRRCHISISRRTRHAPSAAPSWRPWCSAPVAISWRMVRSRQGGIGGG